MDNFSEGQYERFEAYRRHALPKAAVRKVIQQTLGQQVSQPVAQIVAGFSKVFVGEMVEKGSFTALICLMQAIDEFHITVSARCTAEKR